MEAKYWFYLALASIILAYYFGAVQLLKTGGPLVLKLGNLSFGRNEQGQYPAYPSNAGGG